MMQRNACRAWLRKFDAQIQFEGSNFSHWMTKLVQQEANDFVIIDALEESYGVNSSLVFITENIFYC
jgi:hypothetical protein